MAHIKGKERNWLNLESDLILYMAKMDQRFEKIMKDKQAQLLHRFII